MSKGIGDLALDANAVIAYFRDDERAVAWVEAATALFFPVIAVGELEYGALHGSQSKKNLRRISGFLTEGTVLNVARSTARRYGEVRQMLALHGKPIPEADLWIAAICLEHHVPLLSEDGHFSAVAGLTWHNWKTPVPS